MNNTILALKYNLSDVIDFKIVRFDSQRSIKFTNKWLADQKSININKFTESLSKSSLFQKFPSNPLLLTLLCLVFEEMGEVPSNCSQLYQEGLNILLKKWDNRCHIERDYVYRNLSLQRKKDLLSQIALKTFEQGNYYFNHQELKQYISDYICNLPNAQTNLELLQLDSEAVLKSIEAQHGILVELTKGIYSFSLLAFHEYFTAKEIIDKSEPQALEKALQNLVSHITEVRWREVFLIAASMVRNADYLLSLIKRQIDTLVASEQELRHFLAWNNQNSNSDKTPYKSLALRAFYLEFVLNIDFDLARSLDHKIAYNLNFNRARVYKYTQKLQNIQFSEQQKKVLKQYYDANKLLIDCLNNAHYVTRSVREEIENTLLVPVEIL